jgi:pyruvate dehydrogenase E2 component (dihydrolipoamide acetyltransferase)
MAIAIRLPDMGTNVEECRVLTWKVKEGDLVKRGDVLADIETDKAVAELESTAEGVLLQRRVLAGATARTGEILAYVGQAGESIITAAEGARGADDPHEQKAGDHGEIPMGTAPIGPLRVSPIVRNLAAKLGVDLQQVKGTGAGGIITREDVQRAHSATSSVETSAPSPAEQLPRLQAAVARAVQKSWREIPHLRISASIDMSRAQEWREKSRAGGSKISYDAIFLKAMARAAVNHPLFLARLEGERIVRPQGIHIALAVGFADDLYLPVIRDVDQKDLRALHAEISELTGKIKAHALKFDPPSGATMALSNLGMYPVESFDAIIFPEHSSILAVGCIQAIPVFIGGEVEIRPRVMVKVAADHRLINGRAAAEFLTEVKNMIESENFS